MALRCEIHDGAWLVFFQHGADCICIADRRMHKSVFRPIHHWRQGAQVACISEGIQTNNRFCTVSKVLTNITRSNESC